MIVNPFNISSRHKSFLSKGYHAGYTKDDFGCNKRPCECAGIQLKDRTLLGMVGKFSFNKIFTNDVSILY